MLVWGGGLRCELRTDSRLPCDISFSLPSAVASRRVFFAALDGAAVVGAAGSCPATSVILRE